MLVRVACVWQIQTCMSTSACLIIFPTCFDTHPTRYVLESHFIHTSSPIAPRDCLLKHAYPHAKANKAKSKTEAGLNSNLRTRIPGSTETCRESRVSLTIVLHGIQDRIRFADVFCGRFEQRDGVLVLFDGGLSASKKSFTDSIMTWRTW